jgi:hypothetical protein
MTNLRPGELSSNIAFSSITRKYQDGERIFRLGFLVGLGWDARRIANDKIIMSTHNCVHRQVQRYGGHFREEGMRVELTQDAAGHFDKAAYKRGMSREKLIQVLLLEIAKDPNLLDNILDDGF